MSRRTVPALVTSALLYCTGATATDCNTNCSDQCSVQVWVQCPTLTEPFRQCPVATTDPACFARCTVEKTAACTIPIPGANSCQLWESSSDYQTGFAYLSLAQRTGLIPDKAACYRDMSNAQTASSAGGIVKFAYNGFSLASISPAGVVAVGLGFSAVGCACGKLFG
jgi:hypothetical protein